MKQIFNKILPSIEMLIKYDARLNVPAVSCYPLMQKRTGKSGRITHSGGHAPMEIPVTKEWTHKWYKWGYNRLPTQTSLDVLNPQFAIRPPTFKLPKTKNRSRRNWRERVAEVAAARRDPVLEKLARDRQLMVSVDDIEEEWCDELGLVEISHMSKFYGINRDLFDNNDVNVETWLDVGFDGIKIHRGNIVEPKVLQVAPSEINYKCNEDSLTTLVLTNLDGHPLDNSKEILHGMVCNIPSGRVEEGFIQMDYLPPMPWKGTGLHRLVFVLYKQNDHIDISNNDIGDGNTLVGRTFSSFDFSSSFNMTPIGLAWFQSQWDDSVASTCSRLSDLSGEPIFEFEEYIEPKEERKHLKHQLAELNYRS